MVEDLEKLTIEELREGRRKLSIKREHVQTSLKWLNEIKDKIKPEVCNLIFKTYQNIIDELEREDANYLDNIAFYDLRRT